jgi:hypothetical protein
MVIGSTTFQHKNIHKPTWTAPDRSFESQIDHMVIDARHMYFLLLRRLNRGLDTRQWKVYERREDPNGVRLVLSIDTASVTILEGLKWGPFSGVRQAIFSLLGTKPEGRK